MPNSMKQIVIYPKNDFKWEDLVDQEDIEEGEILEVRNKHVMMKEVQKVEDQEMHKEEDFEIQQNGESQISKI